jgi:hypothetical protein
LLVSDLPKNDPRYLKWRLSLKRRPPPWSKGKTKETDASVRKISETFKRKKIDNFAKWRETARLQGKIPPLILPELIPNEKLATLIGLILGDGHISPFPRTEKLAISLGTDKPKLINFAAHLVETIFHKKPLVRKVKHANMVNVEIYQRQISTRLGVPAGNRRHSKVGIPKWAWVSEKYLIACLRGLYEAEASLSIHLPTCTYNFAFHNKNPKLLKDVKTALIKFGLHPEVRPVAIRLRKRAEVKYFQKLINFRKYNNAG